MKTKLKKFTKVLVLSSFSAIFLASCAENRSSYISLLSDRRERNLSTFDRASKAISHGQYGDASRILNQNLLANVVDARLHFLNGLSYHLQAYRGNFNNLLLAQHGYRVALRLDPYNALYLRQMSRLEEQLGDFQSALRYQAEAAVLKPTSNLDRKLTARSAYLSASFEEALILFESLLADTPDDAEALSGAAISAAASGDAVRAEAHLKALSSISLQSENFTLLRERVEAWNNYRQFGQAILRKAGEAKEKTKTDDKDSTPETVVFDIMFIEMSRSVATRRGVNLFEGLAFTLGQDPAGTSALSRIAEQVDTRGTLTETITTAISIPAITYSLNIFNSAESKAEIVSNPSLVATVGKESVLFSGLQMVAAETSGVDSNTIQVDQEIGLKLTLKPEILENGKISLELGVENSRLSAPNTDIITFSLRVDVAKTTANIHANLDFDQTLVIGGLNQRSESVSSSGTPLIGDAPVLDTVFSNRVRNKLENSVVILVTPRAAETLSDREDVVATRAQKIKTTEILLDGYLKAIGLRPENYTKNTSSLKAEDMRMIRVRDLPKSTWWKQEELDGILDKARETETR